MMLEQFGKSNDLVSGWGANLRSELYTLSILMK